VLKSYLQGSVFGREYGVGNPAALALHGWRRSHEDWAPLLNGLPALALDLPGFGASPPPPGAWGSAEYAEFLSPLLDAFPDIQILVGHSFGGRIAVQLAARRPERFRHVILAGVPLVRVVPHPTPSPVLQAHATSQPMGTYLGQSNGGTPAQPRIRRLQSS